MTTAHTSNGTDHHENGRRPSFTGNGVVVTDLSPLAHTDLDALCRSVMDLARGAPKPPLRIKLQHGHMTVELEWPEGVLGVPGTPPGPPGPGPGPGVGPGPGSHPAPAATCGPAVPEADHPSPVPPPEEGMRYLLAPTVGTFYHSPEPGAPPFVAVGDVVRQGQPVGILEVMKLMSPVEAVTGGRVTEILVPDARPVEFEQRLIALEPLPGTGV